MHCRENNECWRWTYKEPMKYSFESPVSKKTFYRILFQSVVVTETILNAAVKVGGEPVTLLRTPDDRSDILMFQRIIIIIIWWAETETMLWIYSAILWFIKLFFLCIRWKFIGEMIGNKRKEQKIMKQNRKRFITIKCDRYASPCVQLIEHCRERYKFMVGYAANSHLWLGQWPRRARLVTEEINLILGNLERN